MSTFCICVEKSEGGDSEETKEEPKKEKEAEAVVVEELEIEEPDEPPRPSALKQALMRFQEEVWPKISWLFIFKIHCEGNVGTFLRLFGCIMVFLSCFTITYQVNTHTHTHTPASFNVTLYLQASFQNNKYQLWIANYMFELYFLFEVRKKID